MRPAIPFGSTAIDAGRMLMIRTLADAVVMIKRAFDKVKDLEDGGKEIASRVNDLHRKYETLEKQQGYNTRLLDHQRQELDELEERVKVLESQKRGAQISAGIAKARLERERAGKGSASHKSKPH
jgi:peptidoglycan hydrolase CwlO-like protein